MISFNCKCRRASRIDRDAFDLEYSIDNGETYHNLFQVTSRNHDNFQSVVLPSGISGEILLRVTDSDSSRSDRRLNYFIVD